MAAPDLDRFFREAKAQIVALARDLSDAERDRVVPGTPLWTVGELISHCVGVGVDLVAGRVPANGPDEAWTASHVAQRRGRSTAEVLAEWDAAEDAIAAAVTERRILPPVFDVIVHEHDLRGALGRPADRDAERVAYAAAAMGKFFRMGCEREGLAPVTIDAPLFELFRLHFGRRSEAQARAYRWVGTDDPTPYLALLTPFTLSVADVVE